MRAAFALALVLAAAPAYAERIVAIAPLSTLGAEDKSAAAKQLAVELERAFASLPATRVIPAASVGDAIARAKKPALRACEGDPACLADVGKLVGAQVVIAGEVGGLGASQVVYLSATEVASAKELRATTLAIGDKDTATAAAVRLLEPDRFRGSIHFAIDVPNATVFVNGNKVTLASGSLALPVGTHAIRVTHPQYHDFVRFVDVSYERTTEVAVGMHQYPIIEHDVRAKPTSRDTVVRDEPAWWRRPYIVVPAVIVLGVVTGAVVGHFAHDFPLPPCRKVGDGQGC